MAFLLTPYITFDGNAREAMEFYQGVLGGDLDINLFGAYGVTDPVDSQKVMHAQLTTEAGATLMASDNPPGYEYVPGRNIALSLSGEDEAQLRGYWDGLSDGGTVIMPIEKQMWGDIFGMLADKFGIQWMVNINLPKDEAPQE